LNHHRISPPRRAADDVEARPSADQPGTLGEQLEAIDLFLANPARAHDREMSWQLARRLAIPHARRNAA
jgi:hypothetical protein